MKAAQTKHYTTVLFPKGGFLHIHRSIVPIEIPKSSGRSFRSGSARRGECAQDEKMPTAEAGQSGPSYRREPKTRSESMNLMEPLVE